MLAQGSQLREIEAGETALAFEAMRALLDWCAEEARRLGCQALHLDSGVEANRLDAHRLYLNTGMRITSFHFAKAIGAQATEPPASAKPL